MIKKLKNRYRYSSILIKEFVKVDYKIRYQDSVFGYAWSFLKPFLLFLMTWIVFTKFMDLGKGVPHWSISLLIGTVFWSFFVEITTNSLTSIVDQKETIRKINFPKYIVVISSSIGAIINMFFNLIVVFIFAFINKIDWQPNLILLFLLIIELYVFATGLGFFLSSLFVYLRDLNNIWEVMVQAYMYASIIIFPITTVENHSLQIAKFALLNPMAQIIQDMRYLISGTDTVWKLWNHSIVSFTPVTIVLLIFILGIIYFKKHSKLFAEDV
jgi:ABC-2 type transport system permease protein